MCDPELDAKLDAGIVKKATVGQMTKFEQGILEELIVS